MIAELAALVPIGQQMLLTAFFAFLRVGAVMALLPAFGEQSVPQRVRLVLTIAFTLVVAPAASGPLSVVTTGQAPIGMAILGEVAAGLALGIILRLLVIVLQMAGQLAAQATSLSQIFGGPSVDPQPATSHVLVVAGLALAVMTGLHVRAAQAMIFSYQMLPPGGLPDAATISQWGIVHIARGFGLALTLSMPFVIASLVYNLALGVINRAMPQLMVAFVGAPAITAGGLILLAISAPLLLDVWSGWMLRVLENPFGDPP
ncbi:flagellar biosynthesis protein FliR [Actibacterium mucosum KCTC 23349]|uniref:Flagellar biosynthesis protein FliR n=1 Tax=Actibacterium mucosum KCTC 23349 TaxID=1454373 RepID=A0A037ZP60_9RHOB|nr:flagellar biosynthetic protein FliR [Actibacterium mucosum]KAJ57338.1 flagellar biosynthesis protein FliR [Actibacterium mucosum KCTC 23349]